MWNGHLLIANGGGIVVGYWVVSLTISATVESSRLAFVAVVLTSPYSWAGALAAFGPASGSALHSPWRWGDGLIPGLGVAYDICHNQSRRRSIGGCCDLFTGKRAASRAQRAQPHSGRGRAGAGWRPSG